MSHLRNLKEANLDTDSLVTIGVFDGVHLGHQQLIQRLVDSARASGRKAVVLTFYPHPDKVLETVKTRYYLMTPEKRAEQLLKLGVDLVVTHPFDNETRHLPATRFIDLLIERLRIKELWVGADFALGFQRKGDVRYLRAQGAIRGFKVTAVELITAHSSDEFIRSSVIRDHVRNGNMRAASAMLGRAYTMEGPVVAGERRGRSIGAPTAKTPLHDFDRDIYGELVELAFERRLRREQKFSSLDDLVEQIQTDIAETRRSLQRHQSV